MPTFLRENAIFFASAAALAALIATTSILAQNASSNAITVQDVANQSTVPAALPAVQSAAASGTASASANVPAVSGSGTSSPAPVLTPPAPIRHRIFGGEDE